MLQTIQPPEATGTRPTSLSHLAVSRVASFEQTAQESCARLTYRRTCEQHHLRGLSRKHHTAVHTKRRGTHGCWAFWDEAGSACEDLGITQVELLTRDSGVGRLMCKYNIFGLTNSHVQELRARTSRGRTRLFRLVSRVQQHQKRLILSAISLRHIGGGFPPTSVKGRPRTSAPSAIAHHSWQIDASGEGSSPSASGALLERRWSPAVLADRLSPSSIRLFPS